MNEESLFDYFHETLQSHDIVMIGELLDILDQSSLPFIHILVLCIIKWRFSEEIFYSLSEINVFIKKFNSYLVILSLHIIKSNRGRIVGHKKDHKLVSIYDKANIIQSEY